MKRSKQLAWAAVAVVSFLAAPVCIIYLIGVLQTDSALIRPVTSPAKTIIQEPQVYQSIHRYKFSYPKNWKLNAASPEVVSVQPGSGNPYQTAVFEYVNEPVPVGIAIVCDLPTTLFKVIKSGQEIRWSQQTYCVMGEERSKYGIGSLIEANIPLADGQFLHVIGNFTTKPDDESATIQAVLYSLVLE